MVHIVFDNQKATAQRSFTAGVIAAFTSLDAALAFASGYGQENYPRMHPTERGISVVSKGVVAPKPKPKSATKAA